MTQLMIHLMFTCLFLFYFITNNSVWLSPKTPSSPYTSCLSILRDVGTFLVVSFLIAVFQVSNESIYFTFSDLIYVTITSKSGEFLLFSFSVIFCVLIGRFLFIEGLTFFYDFFYYFIFFHSFNFFE
jgi:hypothetical protein